MKRRNNLFVHEVEFVDDIAESQAIQGRITLRSSNVLNTQSCNMTV
jgi:hypothetical protein